MPRTTDPVWKFFEKMLKVKNSGKWAKCKKCAREMQGIPSRMKKHYEECWLGQVPETEVVEDDVDQDEVQPTPNDPIPGPSMSTSTPATSKKRTHAAHQYASLSVVKDSAVVSTSDAYAERIDEQIGRYFFATNTPFTHIEHPEFIKLCQLMRPGYQPPSRKQLSEKILDSVHEKLTVEVKQELNGQVVSMCLDGWSNVHMEPIVCSSAVLQTGVTYLIDSFDTSGSSHTAEYLAELATKSIQNCKSTFGADVRSFVTDNAANVKKMRELLAKSEDINVITYGCSAHLFNLLSGDVEIRGVKENLVSVIKYFRNKQLPAAWYKNAGGTMLVLPQEVRWNTLSDSIRAYLKNRGILVQVCQDHKSEIDAAIFKIVNDVSVANNAQDYLDIMLPIAVALDKVQKSNTMISTCVEIWHDLANDLQSQPSSVKKQVSVRRDMALGPMHYLANMLDHRYLGKNLSDDQKSCVYEYLANSDNTCHAELIPFVVAVQHGETFPQYLFTESFKKVTPMTWWKVAVKTIPTPLREQMIELCCQLFSAVASTAGLERIFSSFGLVHSKLRNRLGNEKASKLTFLFRALNQEVKPCLASKGSLEQQKRNADAANVGPSTVTEPELPALSTDASPGDGE